MDGIHGFYLIRFRFLRKRILLNRQAKFYKNVSHLTFLFYISANFVNQLTFLVFTDRLSPFLQGSFKFGGHTLFVGAQVLGGQLALGGGGHVGGLGVASSNIHQIFSAVEDLINYTVPDFEEIFHR